jgi:chaperonin GroES
MNFKPVGSRVIVLPDKPESTWGGGLIKPDSVIDGEKFRADFGVVVAVGGGDYSHNGLLIPMEVAVGDRVVLDPSMTVMIGDTDYAYTWERNIVAVVKDVDDEESGDMI